MKDRRTLGLSGSATATLHGGARGDRVHREYLDFVVDGSPLRELVLRRIGEVDAANDYASLVR